jgi:choline dehydrogenase-like flavoprotein
VAYRDRRLGRLGRLNNRAVGDRVIGAAGSGGAASGIVGNQRHGVRARTLDQLRGVANVGVKRWGFDDLLAYFKRSESAVGGDPAVRGDSGRMRIAVQQTYQGEGPIAGQ